MPVLQGRKDYYHTRNDRTVSNTNEFIKEILRTDLDDVVFESAPAQPDDEFWLDQGRKMLSEASKSVESVANSLITVLGVILGFIQGVYLALIGFAKIIPSNLSIWSKILFVIPLVLWLIALFACIRVALPRRVVLNPYSPDDIREKLTKISLEKQRNLLWVYVFLAVGLLLALILIVFSNTLI